MKKLLSLSRPGARSSWISPAVSLFLLLTPGIARADDFDALREEWRDFMTGGTNLNLSDPAISSKVSSISSAASSRWTSMDKTPGRTNLWSDAASTTVSAHITTNYRRLREMALGYATTGSAYFGNATLAADTIAGLDWMYTNRYNETKTAYNNWWDWEIGVPHALNDCMVLLYPLLTSNQVQNYGRAIEKFSPTVTMTGANRVWKAVAVGVRGVLVKDAAKLVNARDGLSGTGVFPYVTTGDGFYTDGSFVQHGKHPYTAGYGLSLFGDISKMLVWLDGSPWQVTDSKRTNVINWVYDSFEPMIYRTALPAHLRGREMSRSGTDLSAGRSAINTILRLSQTAPAADSLRMKRMIKYWDQVDTTSSLTSYASIDLVPAAEQILNDPTITPRGELIGHYQFPSMDRVMHLRPGYAFGLSLYSSRIYNYECINSENWKGWYMSEGLTYVWNDDQTQFTDAYWPTVDPYHLPGTTVELTPRANGSGQSTTSGESWVGGAALSNLFGAAGMTVNAWSSDLAAKKSWFMFDDEIVCLGAGITATTTNAVHTTIENRQLNNAAAGFIANGTALSTALGWSSSLNNVSWCSLEGVGGWYFPVPTLLQASRTARTGKWSDINVNGSTTSYTRNYLTLIQDHGVKPTDASYAYALLPGVYGGAVGAYAAAPEFVVLTNTAGLQAVKETTLGIVAANFWETNGGSIDLLSVDRAASVMVCETTNSIEVALSDPTQLQTSAIVLTLDRSSGGLLRPAPGVTVLQMAPITRLSFAVSGKRGQTLVASLSFNPNIIALPDSAATAQGTAITIPVLANDLGIGPALSLLSVHSPTNGTASMDADQVVYRPFAGFTGNDGMTYITGDGQHFATGQVNVLVSANILPVSTGQITASTFQVGNPPENAADGSLGTRWSADGNPQWLQYDLRSRQLVDAVSAAFYNGDTRLAYFDLLLSPDGTNWVQLFAGQSSGTTTNLQRFELVNTWARFVRLVGHGNSASTWNSVTEMVVHVAPNAAPVPGADNVATQSGQAVFIPVLANDSDADGGPLPLALVSVGTPAYGTAGITNGLISYAPAAGFSGLDTFSYVVSDSSLGSTGTVNVTVTNQVLDPPRLSVELNPQDQLVLSVETTAGVPLTILATPNPADPLSWSTVLTTNASATPFLWIDQPSLPGRYYRARLGQ